MLLGVVGSQLPSVVDGGIPAGTGVGAAFATGAALGVGLSTNSAVGTAAGSSTASAVGADVGGGGHRYWRISVTATSAGNSTNIAEIEFRSAPGGADQASGGTVSVSGTLSGSPSDAFDNNAATPWHSSLTAGPWWIAYDFGSGVTKAIVEVSIQAHPANPAYSPIDFAIEYSDNGSSWTQEWAVTGSSGWAAGEIRVFTKP